MKKIAYIFLGIMLAFPAFADDIEDTQILDELTQENSEPTEAVSFQLQKFDSCEDMESVVQDFLKDYKTKYPYFGGFHRGGDLLQPLVMEDGVAESVDDTVSAKSSGDFSQTNEQVAGVSESEIIKTNGEYIYYMSDYYDRESSAKNYQQRQKKNVFVIEVASGELVKKIKLPHHFYGTQLYLENDKLVILATGHPEKAFQKQYWDNSAKTYSIIYNVENPAKPVLEKVFMSEGSFSKSRLIGNMLYTISRKDMYRVFSQYQTKKEGELEVTEIIPKGLEISYTENEAEKNITQRGKKRNLQVETGYVSGCDDVEYLLPESDSDLGLPNFHMISVINIDDYSEKAETKVIFGNINEIYMNLDNLYITSRIYNQNHFACPRGFFCIQPLYYGGTNHTLIHKFSRGEKSLDYRASTLVPGQPLTQYSMDEYQGNFRILTHTSRWNSTGEDQSHTDLFILDENLEELSRLEGLGNGEDFKSSRYIGEKLFLVTFEQVDPLYAIDVADPKNPEILGELKIPGYSTYLHPYDENHLIGLGYDTAENQWGGITNSGVKVDLYKINYDKKCGDSGLTDDEVKKCETGDYKGIIVEQLQTKTFGQRGSYSEALSNPRMFVWNAERNMLLLPVREQLNMTENSYQAKKIFSGTISIDVDPEGIEENYRISHVDTSIVEQDRIAECSKYGKKEEEEAVCKEVIGGGMSCSTSSTVQYVPKYCYADASLDEYYAAKQWNYPGYIVKRNIWIDDTLYTISDKKMQKSDLETGKFISNTLLNR